METQHIHPEEEHIYMKLQKSHQRGRIASGIFIILFGSLYLIDRLGYAIPSWTFDWPMIVIAAGIVVLIKHKFKKLFGYGVLLVGILFLLNDWYPKSINTEIIFPIIIIASGFSFLFKTKRHHHRRFTRENWRRIHEHDLHQKESVNEDDFLDTVSIFGGVQKTVVSKNFKGADIVTIFGGNEINLSQVDFKDRVVFDISCFFGGTTLTIPSDWQVNSEIATIFGGIEDKRPTHLIGQGEHPKILILRGTCMFGGIEINSYQK